MAGDLLSFITFAAAFELRDFLLPAAVLLIVLVLMRRATKMRRRGRSTTPLPTNPRQLASSKAAPSEANAWMVELHDLARDTSAQIDTKLASLRLLLLQAAEQQQRLEELLDRLDAKGPNPRPAESPPPQVATNEPLTDHEARIAALSQSGYSDVYISNQVKASLPEVRQVLSRLGASSAQPPVA
ncbi:MAG: hypothetical protein WD030_03795 [Pirellulales bacterium]